MLISPYFAAFSALTSVGAVLLDRLNGRESHSLNARQTSRNEQGYMNDRFYSFWSDGIGQINFTRYSETRYSVTWKQCSNFVSGIGWNPGSGNRTIKYDSEFVPGANGYLAVYGWTRNPRVEYYVIESYGIYVPRASGDMRYMGTVDSDGGSYNIYSGIRYGPGLPSSSFRRFWSVRNTTRVSGKVTLKNHFDAWRSLGMELGTHEEQIMAVEGYQSTGNATVVVHPE